ncbi:hypothetical protein ABEX38_29860 [Priestia megaterium]
MTNALRGEKVLHLDKERTLKFSLNALVEAEEALGFPLSELGDKMSIRAMRALLYAGLKHEDAELTELQVGDMITMDNMEEVQVALTEAMGGSKN